MEQSLQPDAVSLKSLQEEAISLLSALIRIPSFSKEEKGTADAIQEFLERKGVSCKRKQNNVWAFSKHVDSSLPTILLNSHHDTVKPNPGYTRDPFLASEEKDKLYGLGSNDAGGALVSLVATFLYFHDKKGLPFNLVLAATAEEEISGSGGLELILPELGALTFGIVGEPTLMHLAIAEKGLLVIDCICKGKSGHAAREEGDNAIYKSMKDITWFRDFRFSKISPYLGPIKMSVTMIQAGSQHNVVPGECKFTVDIRLTEMYTHDEIIRIIQENITSEIHPRSTRLRPSSISEKHPIVLAGLKWGRKTYGSPTTSDQALLNIPSLKLGPGDSARSHTADEFIYTDEIRQAILLYIQLLSEL
jgi:acetylornithine deacetylase